MRERGARVAFLALGRRIATGLAGGLLVAGLLLGLPGCAARDVARARAYSATGQHTQAAEAYGQAVARSPGDLRLRMEYARSLLRAGDLAGAEREARTLARLAPKAAEPHVLLARVAERNRRYDEALAHLRRAVEVSPGRPGPLMVLGTALLRYKQPARAVEVLERAVKLAAKDGRVWNNLALARYRAGDVKGAEAAYRRALELRTDDASMRSLLGLGALYVNEKRYHDAIRIYERALRAQPDKPEIHVGLALLHAGTGQRAKAARAFARAGELFLDGARIEEAVVALRRAQRLLPGDAQIAKRLRRAEQAAASSSARGAD